MKYDMEPHFKFYMYNNLYISPSKCIYRDIYRYFVLLSPISTSSNVLSLTKHTDSIHAFKTPPAVAYFFKT